MPEEAIAIAPAIEKVTTEHKADAPVKINDPFASLELPKKDVQADKSKPADKTPVIDDKKAADAPDSKKQEDKPATDKSAEKKVIGQKKPFVPEERIKQQNEHIAKLEGEIKTWKTRAEEAEKKGGGDTTALTGKIKELEAQNKKLQGELSAKDYSKDPEYEKNYNQPYVAAAANGKKVFESLEIIEKDADGNVTGKRVADWKKDFAPIYSLPRAAARARAKELFGDDIDAITSTMGNYDKIHEADEKRQQALTEWETGASEREQKTRAEQIQKLEQATKAFQSATNDMIEANPDYFRDNPENPEEVELRKKGMVLVDAAYFSRDKMSPKELLVLDAAIRLRAGNYNVIKTRLTNALSELAEYKSRFEQKEESKNGKTRRTGTEEKSDAPEDWRADLKRTVDLTNH